MADNLFFISIFFTIALVFDQAGIYGVIIDLIKDDYTMWE